MKVLVTGGTGVIGAAAIPALLRAGHKVRLLSRHADHDASNFPAGVEAAPTDISDPTQLGAAMGGCEAVLHIAGIVEEEPPEITFEKINVAGTQHLLTAASDAGEPYFIFISSLGADEGDAAYQHSKIQAEKLVRAYAGPWLVLRPGNVYGPGDGTISMLLKMVRTLPAVPMVDRGDQSFQPMWYSDFGDALAQAVDRRDLAGETLKLAGPDVTTTHDVLQRLAVMTGCNPPRLEMPSWLAKVGVQALEMFDAAGKKLLRRVGMDAPLSSAKLSMLLQGSVIPDSKRNALLHTFSVAPTSLDDGLQMLADLLPEQLPGDGVGALKHATFSADIRGSKYSAPALLDHICENIQDVMPIEFSSEPGAPTSAKEGGTLTARIAGRGNVQVRLEERTAYRATFLTIEGHPLAGVMQLHTEDLEEGVRFSVHTASQPANLVDWIALHTIGAPMQASNWRGVVRRVIELSGGEALDGIRHIAHKMDATEARDLRQFADRLVQQQQRERNREKLAG